MRMPDNLSSAIPDPYEALAHQMKTISISLRIAALTAALFSFSQAYAGKAAKADVIGMLFHADWCGSCKILDPKIESAEKEFAGKPILFSKFDLTDSETRATSAKLSKEIGMGPIFEKHGNRTGFFLLVDAKSKEVLSTITSIHTEDDIKSKINQALAKEA